MNTHLGRTVLICAVLLAAGLESPAAAATAPLVLEGFEDDSTTAKNPSVRIVKSAPGLTQGVAAAELAPGGAVAVKASGADIARLPWLRIDTHHSGDGTRGLQITINSTGFGHRARGHVQTGKDTLAFPLTMVVPAAAEKTDKRVFAIVVTNASDIPIVIDNIRLEPLVRTPRGAVLWDFGRTGGAVWPGFARKGVSSKSMKWKGDISYYGGYSVPYLDPLTQDFIGPYSSNWGSNTRTPVAIAAPAQKSMAAWLWVTHYGNRYYQPQEYRCRAAMGRPVGRKLTAGQLVGPAGLLEGAGGLWTPKWYAEDYADHFVTLMPFTMPKGVGMIELGNCQMAALAMAPSAGRSAMASCIKQIQSELVRYRRQFVMKQLNRNLCSLKPTEAEKKAGLMLFETPGDEAFTGLWKPRADQRAWAIHKLAQPGGTIRIPLAFVPLQKKFMAFSVITGSLRSDSDSMLPLNRSSVQIDHIHWVPEVRKGVTIRRPWLLASKSPPVEVRGIGYVWLTITIPSQAKEGLYRGTWKLGSGVARTNLPVEIEIVNCGRRNDKNAETFTLASHGLPSASTIYSSALSALPKAKQQKLKSDVFRQVRATGVNAYAFPAAEITSGDSSGTYVVNTADMQTAIDNFPFKELPGPMFLSLSQALGRMSWGKKSTKKAVLDKAIAQTNALCSQYSINRRYFHFGYSAGLADTTSSAGLTTRLAGAKLLASENCPVVIHTRSSALKALSPVDFSMKLMPVSALIITPDSPFLASQIADFRKLSGTREVYLHSPYADRFAMGFLTAAVRADGCVLAKVFMAGGPYNGYYLNGAGLVAPQLGGKLAQTASAFRLKQAQDDRNLMNHARTLLIKATQADVTAKELSGILSEIESRARALTTLRYDYMKFATTRVSHAEMDSWRASLLNAMGAVNRRLGGPKRQ
ncbi:MAG: hypothetical protein QGG42_00615 [Phycisphaerae bacterium]|nr:hypothetical protein [Phycisphaerae bacterium]